MPTRRQQYDSFLWHCEYLIDKADYQFKHGVIGEFDHRETIGYLNIMRDEYNRLRIDKFMGPVDKDWLRAVQHAIRD